MHVTGLPSEALTPAQSGQGSRIHMDTTSDVCVEATSPTGASVFPQHSCVVRSKRHNRDPSIDSPFPGSRAHPSYSEEVVCHSGEAAC